MTDSPEPSAAPSLPSAGGAAPAAPPRPGKKAPGALLQGLGAALCLFAVAEVNYPRLTPQTQLAIFSGLGLTLCFLSFPAARRWRDHPLSKLTDRLLAALSSICCLYVAVQSEPIFEALWLGGVSLGDRAGSETTPDLVVGAFGLALVLEAARRTVGLSLPLLSALFLAYAALGPRLPDWFFPHRGYSLERIVGQTFLHSQGVFGVALQVMFTYVFLFVLFGVLLEVTGATAFILGLARRVFRNSPGGAAKVSVLSSGLMGSLSGSAVANTATTGTFTIPMMRSGGMKPHIAGGVEAASSSGGALVPPVMGAGAYMMLELVQPAVTYLEILRAALIPALLYYFSLFLIVHFKSRRNGPGAPLRDSPELSLKPWAGVVFLGSFLTLIALLLVGYSPFRAASVAALAVLISSTFRKETRLGLGSLLRALAKAARDMVPLIAAAASVGVILGVVTLTGVGGRLPSALLPLAEQNLLLALIAIMASSIVLGMGLPSAVCYLLMATLVGPVLSGLGVVPLAAHLFIFYFGMMSMVTPPVALAAYTAASISGSNIWQTSIAAFRFALVGFTLPFMFVYRPELLLLTADGSLAAAGPVLLAVGVAVLGIAPLAAAIAGSLFGPLRPLLRAGLLAASALLLLPIPSTTGIGLAVLALCLGLAWRQREGRRDGSPDLEGADPPAAP